MFIGEALGTFQLHQQRVLNQEIRKIFPHRIALVKHGKRSFGGRPDAPKTELAEQGALIHLLEESGAQRFETSKMAPSTASLKAFRSVRSAFICGLHF
jgi:hypothetical protein